MPYKDKNSPQAIANHNKRQKKYYEKKKKEIALKNKTDPNRLKTHRISGWKRQGILCFDYNLLYDLFLKTTHCEYCGMFLQGIGRDQKCLDHDHSINDKFNIRAVLCKSCNNKDVLN